MSLDTAQKRGSAISLSLPWREWQSKPSGGIDVGPRLSLLKLTATAAGGGGGGGLPIIGSLIVRAA